MTSLGSRLALLVATILCVVGILPVQAGTMQLPVPRVTIYPGQVIDKGMLVDRAFRINDPAGTIVSHADLVGKVARQTLLPGRPISTAGIREPHAVTQGESTPIIFQSGALTISGTAIALQSGATGDMVSVRNVDSGRIIKGVIGADGAVHVGDP